MYSEYLNYNKPPHSPSPPPAPQVSSDLSGFTFIAPQGVRYEALASPVDCTLTDHFLEVLQNVTYKKHSSFGAQNLASDQRDMSVFGTLPLSHRNISPECLDSTVNYYIWLCQSKTLKVSQNYFFHSEENIKYRK